MNSAPVKSWVFWSMANCSAVLHDGAVELFITLARDPWAEGREKIGGCGDGRRMGLARNWGQADAAPSHASGG